MNQPQRFTARLRALAGAMALVAFILAAPLNATAATPSEGTVILNVATVNYTNTAGTPMLPASAATEVTVQLLPAALAITGPNGTGSPTCPPTPVSSGATSTVMNAVVANANGDDDYTLTLASSGATNLVNTTVELTVYDSAGAALYGPGAGPHTLSGFGSAITIGVKTGSTNTLLFPGGVDINAMFAAGDIVVVKTGSPVAYKVVSATNGTAASHTNVGGGNYTVAGTETAESYGELELAAFEVTIGATTYGTNTTPAFDDSPVVPPAGTVVGEMVLIQVSVTADSTSQSVDGTVDFDLTTENTNSPVDTDSKTCNDTTFNQAAQLNIKKEVRNPPATGTWGATATGLPGDILEYRITVTNPDSSNAEVVIVTDAVPDYTTLVITGGVFATASLNGGATVNITSVATDNESATVTSGNAAGTTAGSAINFFLGAGNADTPTDTGGTLAQDDDVVLLYKVTID